MSDNTNASQKATDAAEELFEKHEFGEHTVDEIAAEIHKFNTNYSVPLDEAKRMAVSRYTNSADGSPDPDNAIEVSVESLDQKGKLVNVTVKAVNVFDDPHKSIYQQVVVGDDTDTTLVTEFKGNGDHLKMEEGETYTIEAAETDYYVPDDPDRDGQYNLKIKEFTSIEQVDADIGVPEREGRGGGDETIHALAYNFDEDSSGYIQRCSDEDCTRILDKDDRCAEHGHVENSVDDVRMKVIVDDQDKGYTAYFNREQVEELTGMSLEDAMEIAKDAMDQQAPGREVAADFVGHYFILTGSHIESEYGHRFIVNEFERATFDRDEAEALLEELEADLEANATTPAATGGESA